MATKRTMKYGATISIPMKNISTASDEIISNLKNEKSSLLKKVGKPTSNAIVWSIITAAFMMSIIIITGSAVAIEKSTEEGAIMDKSMIDDTFLCSDASIDCNGHGICFKNGDGCKCDDGFITHNPTNDTQCNYEQKSQLTAFLLALFLGEFGAGRFYVGQASTAVFKFLLIYYACCLNCVCSRYFAARLGLESPMKFGTDISDHVIYSDTPLSGMIFGLCCGVWPFMCASCALTIWCIVDIILFATNSIPDGNGVYLKPM